MGSGWVGGGRHLATQWAFQTLSGLCGAQATRISDSDETTRRAAGPRSWRQTGRSARSARSARSDGKADPCRVCAFVFSCVRALSCALSRVCARSFACACVRACVGQTSASWSRASRKLRDTAAPMHSCAAAGGRVQTPRGGALGGPGVGIRCKIRRVAESVSVFPITKRRDAGAQNASGCSHVRRREEGEDALGGVVGEQQLPRQPQAHHARRRRLENGADRHLTRSLSAATQKPEKGRRDSAVQGKMRSKAASRRRTSGKEDWSQRCRALSTQASTCARRMRVRVCNLGRVSFWRKHLV